MRKTRFIGRAWDIADENIRRYAAALKSGRGNPAICRKKIDQWLEYRKSHKTNEAKYL